MPSRRALHFVFKVGNRTATAKFFREILGMKFLRHEEFEEGCKASCNGPYDGKWSKSMVGYGPEDNHFVIELTYNYGIGSYKLGNDFMGITVHSPSVIENIKKSNYPSSENSGVYTVKSPDGYPFHIVNQQCSGDPVKKVTLATSNLHKSVDATKKTGFCAIKLTALGRPQLLLQMSNALVSARKFFDEMTSNYHGYDTSQREFRDNFTRIFREDEFLFKLKEMGVNISEEDSRKWFSILDLGQDGQVDIMDWDNLLEVNMSLSKLFVVPDPQTGELRPLLNSLSEETEEEMKNMLRRVDAIAKVLNISDGQRLPLLFHVGKLSVTCSELRSALYAAERDVRVMVDAEQSYFQPAINRFTMEMMKKFNKEKAIIFNTYQCYLKSAYDNIKLDVDTAYRHNVYFGAKLVRGAYMEQERERAVSIGYEDPINPTYEATTAMYNKVLRKVMRTIQIQEKGRVAVMVASHNEDTVRYTVEQMKEYGVMPGDKVICFGQLLGMCDQISFPLGQAGYSVYKYVPYGPIDEVLPYLSRRAHENKGILTKVRKEKKMLRQEIFRRFGKGQFIYNPQNHLPDIKPV